MGKDEVTPHKHGKNSHLPIMYISIKILEENPIPSNKKTPLGWE